MAARRAAAAGEELESRHADALGQEMRRGSLPGHAAAHSALADVTAGGPYLDDTVEMLGKVEKQAQELAGSVDTMLSTLATKMGDIAQTSKQHSVMFDNLVSGTEHQAEFAITQMGCLISKCQHLDMELAPVDDMAAEIQDIKVVLGQLEKALANTILRKR